MPARSSVLVVSEHVDRTAGAVVERLRRRGVTPAWVDVGDFSSHLTMAARFVDGRWRGRLVDQADTVDLSTVHAIYYRRPSSFSFPAALSAGDIKFATAEARLGVGGVLASIDALWVNDPTRIALAEYKPKQLQVAARCGLTIPPTLITNDYSAVAEFAEHAEGSIVCKPLSSVVLSESGQPRITYTTVVEVADIDRCQLAATAHLVQQWVPKRHDVRVVTAGQRAYGVAILAHNDLARTDWRADYSALRYKAVDVPDQIAAAMGQYLSEFGLQFGAFDFVVTPDDEWVMLECNPAGQWLWLEHATNLPMTDAMVDLLIGVSNG